MAGEVAAEAVKMKAFEDFVTGEVLKGRSIIGLYPPTKQQSKDDFAAWGKAKNCQPNGLPFRFFLPACPPTRKLLLFL